MTLTIHSCPDHDHVVVCLDGEEVISNDYSIENVIRIAEHLKWTVETHTHTRDEFEQLFA